MNGMSLDLEWELYMLEPDRCIEDLLIRRLFINLRIQKTLVPELKRAADAFNKIVDILGSDK